MDLRKLEALVVAGELGSFTKAAQQLGYSQSGLTHMMNALEQEIGFPLLLRDHRGVRLTAQGQQIYPTIQQLLAVHRLLLHEISACTAEFT